MSSSPLPAERPTPSIDDDARQLALRLLTRNGVATLAVLEPGSGHPLASRTSVACTPDGAPLILVSELAAHTAALRADPRCSLLMGEPGAGDPMAHPRLSLIGRARCLRRGDAETQQAREAYLAALPKAALYADFADFSFWRIEVERASLNGGFGRAWQFDQAEWSRALALASRA